MVRYGAKALPEGGWHTLPQLYHRRRADRRRRGGFVNSMRLKGIHLAMRTGMLAAETAFDAVRAGDTSAQRRCSRTRRASTPAPIKTELYPVRNVHQAFGAGTRRRRRVRRPRAGHRRQGPARHLPGIAGHQRMQTIEDYYGIAKRDILVAVECRADRSPADLRQGHQRALLGHASRRGSAVAPARADRRLPHDLRPGVRPPVHALLSGQRLRDGRRRRRRAAAADQRVELRALQDLRHHGSVPASSPGSRPKAAKGPSTTGCRT